MKDVDETPGSPGIPIASISPDNTRVTVEERAADPRWGMGAAYDKRTKVELASHVSWQTETRGTPTLASPTDPYSMTAQTITRQLWTSAPPTSGGTPYATATSVFTGGGSPKWTVTSFGGRTFESLLDGYGRIVEQRALGSSPALHPVTFSYDTAGRLWRTMHGARTYTANLDAATGWLDSAVGPDGATTSFDLRDANGRPLAVTLPGSRALAFGYDGAGNLGSVTPPGQPAHGFAFDGNDRLAIYAPPDATPTASPKDSFHLHDHDGLSTFLSQAGRNMTYGYDASRRLSRSADGNDVALTYYPTTGKLESIASSDPAGDVTLSYTWDGPLLAQSGWVTSFGTPTHTITRTHDTFGRVATWSMNGQAPEPIGYDQDSLVTSFGGLSLARGTAGLVTGATLSSVVDTFGYSPYAEVSTHTASGSGATLFSEDTSQRDAAGRITARTETVQGTTHTFQYIYDAAGRLWQVFLDGAGTPAREYTYSPNGNRVGGTYDGQDRLTEQAGVSYAYANDGALSLRSDPATGDTWFTYDGHGNLRSVELPAPLAPITYLIDGANRRVGKFVNGAPQQGFVYEGPRVVAELDSNGALLSQFFYVTGAPSPDVMLRAGVRYRLVKDHLGSIRLVVNASTGTVSQRVDYDEWGNVLADTSPGFQPFGFAGGLYDRDTHLVRFGARDYDPRIGRWTTKDAARFGGGLNFYAYAANDPVNFIDVSGRSPLAVAMGAAALIGGFLAGSWYYFDWTTVGDADLRDPLVS